MATVTELNWVHPSLTGSVIPLDPTAFFIGSACDASDKPTASTEGPIGASSPAATASMSDSVTVHSLSMPASSIEAEIVRAKRWIMALCAFGLVWFINIAQAILIPIIMSIVLFLLLRPAVRGLARRRIPEPVGAAFCMLVVGSALVLGILPLIGPARDWIANLPEHLRKVDQKIKLVREQVSQVSEIQTQISDLAHGDTTNRPIPVSVQAPELTNGTIVLSTTGNTLGMVLVVIVLTYFLLIAGDQLISNVLSIMPTFREKRQTVELILDVQRGISSYLVSITVINVGLGVVVALALWGLGVPNPAVWGMMTTLFNYVPFVGQGVTGLLLGLASVLYFDSLGYALLVPVVFYGIAAIEGNLITPAVLGRHMSLNPIIVLVALLFWGWVWGIAGAALAVPLLAITKISCDRFACTRSVGTLLGG